MYAQHYGFTGMPFQLTPDHRFFFGSSVHNRAIAHLIYGLAQEEGFIVVTGEVGSGKTTLVEQLWSQLDRNTYTIARIVTTQVGSDDLLRLTLAGFGIDEQGDKATLLRRLERMLKEERAIGRRCLLVVDEVQSLSTPALEELRMLSNMTEGGRASLQTILLGQPQFRRTLASPDLDQLRQRVLASFHLGPLAAEEVRAYMEHRLRAVGWTDRPIFTDEAYVAIHRHSGGIPRRINRLCSRVLLFGALEETDEITEEMVETTAAELTTDLGGDPDPMLRPVAGTVNGLVPNGHGEMSDLAERVTALEEVFAKRERTLQRLLQTVSGFLETREAP